MTFSENEYVDASQQKKIQQFFYQILAFLGFFVGQKTAKIDKKMEKIVKSINITIT